MEKELKLTNKEIEMLKEFIRDELQFAKKLEKRKWQYDYEVRSLPSKGKI